MFKNVYLSAAFALFSGSLSAQSIDRISEIKNSLHHIAQEKTVIVLNLQKTLIFGNKALSFMKDKLNDSYEQLMSQVGQVINTIGKTEEFNYSVNKITDLQAACITDENMSFNDIEINPADYPLDAVIDKEMSKAFPALDEDTNQLFNIYYVICATLDGSKMLLEKLDLKTQELAAELETLKNSPLA